MASARQTQPRFGFYHLPLEIYECDDNSELEKCIQRIEQQVSCNSDYTVTSNYHLIALCYMKKGDKKKAMEYLMKILREDKTNVNALQSLIENSTDKEKAEEYRLMQKSAIESDKKNVIMGLAFLEQGFVQTFEIYIHDKNFQRYERAIQCYKEGLDLIGNAIADKDVLDFKICFGCAYHKLNDAYARAKKKSDFDKWLEGAAHFLDLCQKAPDNSMCWSYLGQMLTKCFGKVNKNALRAKGLLEYYENPEQCFEKAISLSPGDKEASCRYAIYLLRKRNPERAVEIMQALFATNSPQINWFAHSTYVEALLDLYGKQKNSQRGANPVLLELAEHHSNDTPDWCRNKEKMLKKIRQFKESN